MRAKAYQRHSVFCHELWFIPTCVGLMDAYNGPVIEGYGSSPRAWGKLGGAFCCLVTSRFIPTCVGQMSNIGAALKGNRFIPTSVGQI